MTLLQYVQSLQDQGATDIAAKVEEWKKKNQPKVEVEEVKEVKTEAAPTTGANVAATPVIAPDTELESEDGSLESQKTTYYVLNNDEITENTFDVINKRIKRYEEQKNVTKEYSDRISGKTAPNNLLIEEGKKQQEFSLDKTVDYDEDYYNQNPTSEKIKPITDTRFGQEIDPLGLDKNSKKENKVDFSFSKNDIEKDKKARINRGERRNEVQSRNSKQFRR